MKRILLPVLFALALFLISASAASAFGLKDVVRMHEDGIADSLIIQKIVYSGKTFHLDADDLHALKEAGVSDEGISALLRTEAEYDSRDGYYDYGYDRGYYYPHARVYLGFGLGYYDSWWPYYGGYWYRGYSPYYPYYSRYYGGYHHDYDRYYFRRGYTGYRTPTGQWGDTRYRGQVGSRIYTGNRGYPGYRGYTGSRGYTGYRERTGVAPQGQGSRTRRR